MRSLLAMYLADDAIALTAVSNAHDGIKAFQSEIFDVVLMDLDLPEMDGYEAARLIRDWEAEHGLGQTPILALTALSDFTASKRTFSQNFTLHLNKPISRETLLQTVRQFGSTKRADSGSTLVAETPAKLSSAIVQSIAPQPRAVPAPGVLLVDDDPDVAVLVRAAMAPFHVGVDAVLSGAEAVARLKDRWYDLVVLDLGLPDLSGVDVLNYLKSDRRFRRARVLVLTADSTMEAMARSFGHGADDFIRKPFVVKELGMRAYRLLDGGLGPS
ncbi:MAG: response regulator [Acidobacteriia bacterium]|nr:response regulator [Terriglobia bacterium]